MLAYRMVKVFAWEMLIGSFYSGLLYGVFERTEISFIFQEKSWSSSDIIKVSHCWAKQYISAVRCHVTEVCEATCVQY